MNYKWMVQTWGKYHSNGFEILAFPCNQFANQEPADDATIHKWAQDTYNVEFPMFHKDNVNDGGLFSSTKAQPIYQYLKFHSDLLDEKKCKVGSISWNFAKFLVDADGQVVKHYDPHFALDTIEEDIKTQLGI